MLKYLGGGTIPDCRGELVPARDLTDDEVKHFGKDLLLQSGLYAEVKPSKSAPEPKEKL